MSYKNLWIALIKSIVCQKKKCNPKDLTIVSEHKEGRFYQAKLISPFQVIHSEPTLSEDGAFESLLYEVRKG